MTAPHRALTLPSPRGKVRVAMRRSSLAILVIAVLATIARAQDGSPDARPDFLASPPALPAAYDERTAWRLELAEALQIAMQHNLGIAISRKTLDATRLGVEAATADLYEPRLGASASHTATGAPGTASSRADGTLSVTQRLPTGASLSLGLSASRGSPPSSDASGPGTRGAGVTFSVTQPLLRGFSRDLEIPRAQILTAQIGSQEARRKLEIDAARLVQQTETAYWAVVAALYSYGVQLKAHKLAEDTVTLTRRQIEAGMAAGSELTGAESTVAQSRLGVLQQEAAVEDAWDGLRTVLGLPRDQWQRPILPIDMPRLAPAEPPSEDQALEAALRNRPEIALLRLEREASDLARRVAANDRLPQIDLQVSGSLSGQADSYGALTDPALPSRGFGAMLNLSWTPLGRANRVKTEIARIQREVEVASTDQRIQDIWNEIRAAIRRQRHAALQVSFAWQSLALANKYLEVENRKYLEGNSSNLAIAQLQAKLADAEQQALRALLDNETTRSALLLATGQLLDHRHVRFETAVSPR